jgi:DNA helicase HerA-like ATPase
MRTDAEPRLRQSRAGRRQADESPRLYATFLLWLLSELFEELPEVGDPEKPRWCSSSTRPTCCSTTRPRPLLEKVEQVVRLIRSKGVGVYFVTQNPADMPDAVLAQLGNRVQHALRAYTPAEQKGLRAAAQSFRPNPAFDTAEAIQALGVGEALVSTLDEKGAPCVVQRTLIRPPDSRLGPYGSFALGNLARERAPSRARAPGRGHAPPTASQWAKPWPSRCCAVSVANSAAN